MPERAEGGAEEARPGLARLRCLPARPGGREGGPVFVRGPGSPRPAQVRTGGGWWCGGGRDGFSVRAGVRRRPGPWRRPESCTCLCRGMRGGRPAWRRGCGRAGGACARLRAGPLPVSEVLCGALREGSPPPGWRGAEAAGEGAELTGQRRERAPAARRVSGCPRATSVEGKGPACEMVAVVAVVAGRGGGGGPLPSLWGGSVPRRCEALQKTGSSACGGCRRKCGPAQQWIEFPLLWAPHLSCGAGGGEEGLVLAVG